MHCDPYDAAIDDDPYPTWSRLRDEYPLYLNDELNFYALSRWDADSRSTSNRVNAVPYVVDAQPGLLRSLEMPLTLPRHAFHA